MARVAKNVVGPVRRPENRSTGFTMIELLIVITIIAVMAGAVVAVVKPESLSKKMRTESKRLSAALVMAADEAIFQGNEMGMMLFKNGYQFYIWDQPEALDGYNRGKGGEGEAGAEGEESNYGGNADSSGQVTEIVATTDATAQQPGRWRLLTESPFKMHQLPEPLLISIEVEGEALVLDELEPDGAAALSSYSEASNSEAEESGDEAEDEKIYPALLLLSSGEMTPFSLALYADDTKVDDTRDLVYTITGNLLGSITLTRPGEEEP